MTALSRRDLLAIAFLAAVLIPTPNIVKATDANPPNVKAQGDLWEVTSQMEMEGMPMKPPARTVKVCSAKEWKEPPGAADERRKCKNSDFKTDGPKATWKVTCEGMKGEGEITRKGADDFSGTIKFSSADGAMKIQLDGHRVGDCDAPK